MITSILLGSLLLAGCGPEEQPTGEEDLVRLVNVQVEEVEKEVFETWLRRVGTVTTSSDVRISAEVSGRIQAFKKREGSRVTKGEVVVKIDDRRLQQEVNRQIAVTEQSRENYERLERLYENEQIGSEMEKLNARYSYDQNRASLEALKIDLAHTEIRAPFDGTVEEILVEAGEMVSPGTAVLRMVSLSGMRITLGVPARYADVVDPGDTAQAWFDFDPGRVYTLPITFVGSSIDSRNRTFKVDLELPHRLENVKIDMLANVRLRTEMIPDVIVVNEEYLFSKNGRMVVYLAGENERGQSIAVERVVERGPSFGNRVVINEGLDAGDKLITVGSSYLQDRTRISVVAPPAPPIAEF